MSKVTVVFHGSLKKHGKFEVFADTAREALQLIVAQLPDVKASFVDRFFEMRVASKKISKQALPFYATKHLKDGDRIDLYPKLEGAKGALSFIAGAALITFALSNPFGWAALAVGSTTVGAVAFGVGVAFMVSGAAGLLVKQPKMTTGSTQENARNYGFNNLANSTTQGASIPLCYGKITIGAQVISQGISSVRLNEAPKQGEINQVKKQQALIKARDVDGNQYNTPNNNKTYVISEG